MCTNINNHILSMPPSSINMATVTTNSEFGEGCEEKYKYEPRVPREILNAFDSLVPEDVDEQNKASLIILKYAEVEMQRYNGGDLPADIVYIVTRLVSGLGSPRGHARHGFYTTLQALLQLQPISVSFVMNIAKQKFQHGLKKMDRDSALGELLAYGALIRSGQLKSEETVRSAVIARLLELRKMKTYTEVIASQFLVDVMTMSDLDSVYKEVWSSLRELFSTPMEELTPSLLWIRLILHGRTSLKLPPWMKSSIDSENYSAIGQIIMKTMNDLPQVHPVLQQVVVSLTQKRKSDRNCLKEFWTKAILNHLDSPSHTKLQLIFNFSQMLLQEVKDELEVRTILEGPLVRQLLRSVSLRDRQVDSAARGLAATLLHIMSSHSKENSEIQMAILRAIVTPPGSVRFDKLTGTKFLQQAYKDLALSSVKGYAALLQDILHFAGYRGGGASKSECETAAHWLARLVNHTSVRASEHTKWRANQVVVLLRLSFFTPDVAKSLKMSFKEAFLKSLDRPVRQLEDYRSILMHIILEVDKLIKNQNNSAEVLHEENARYWQQVTAMLQQIEKNCQTSGKDGGSDVFQVLYAYLGIQLFTEPDAARESIDELNLCYKNAQQKILSKGKKKKDGAEETEELEWIDVVVDLLISLLPRKHHLWRTVVQGIFTLLCPVMTPTALLAITDVLNPNRQEDLIGRGKKGCEALPVVEEDKDDEDGWETQEETDSESDDSDDGDDDGDNGDDDDEGEDDDDEEDDEDKEEAENDEDDIADQLADEEVGDKLIEMKRKMMTVLGGDTEDNDVDMDTLTTEEMNKLDTELGAVMKQYLGPRKKKNKTRLTKDETAVMNFRTRVCDLLDIYLKEEPSMSNTLAIIIPVMTALQVVGSDHKQDQFRNRLKNILMHLSRMKCTSTGDARLETVVETLNDVLASCAKVPMDSSKCIGSICIFIVRCGLQLLGDEAHNLNNPVISVLAQHLDEFFTNKDVIPTILAFTGPLTMHSGSIWTLSSTLLHHAFHPSTRLYRRTQAMEMLKFLYKNHKALSRVDPQAMAKFEAEISIKTIKVLDGIEGPQDVKVHYLGHLFNVLKVIKQHHKQHPKGLGMDWEALEGSLAALRNRVTLKPFKDLRAPFNQLCQILEIRTVEISQSKSEKKVAKRLAKQEAKRNRESQMTFDKEDKPEEAKVVPGKKKRSQEWMKQRKRQLGTQVLEDLEGFSFAPQAIFNESLAVESVKDNVSPKKKKTKPQKDAMNVSIETDVEAEENESPSKEIQKIKKKENKKGKKRKTVEDHNVVSSKKLLVDQD